MNCQKIDRFARLARRVITKVCFRSICVWFLLWNVVGFSQEQLPKLSNVTVQCSVLPTGQSGILIYSYTLNNPASNKDAIWSIDLDLSKPEGTVDLSGDGLTNGPGFLNRSSELVISESSSVPTIPIGLECPNTLIGGISTHGTASCGAGSESSLISPGMGVNGLQIKTRGLPGIRILIAQPYLDVDTLTITPPSGANDIKRYLKDLETITNGSSAMVTTIGPTAPPAKFDRIDFLIRLDSYRQECLKQGWIDNAGLANNLQGMSNLAQSALARGDTETARTNLNAFLKIVNAQTGKHLTGEAAALLGVNAHYLIDRL